MGIRLTLLELHGDLQIGPKGIDFEEDSEPPDEDREPVIRELQGSDSDRDQSRLAAFAVLAGLLFLIGLGILAGKLLQDGENGILDEPVELAESDQL